MDGQAAPPARNWMPLVMIILAVGGGLAIALSMFLGSGLLGSKDSAPAISSSEFESKANRPAFTDNTLSALHPRTSPDQMIQKGDKQAMFGFEGQQPQGPGASPSAPTQPTAADPALAATMGNQAQAMGAKAPAADAAKPADPMAGISGLLGGLTGGAPGAAPKAAANAAPGAQPSLQSDQTGEAPGQKKLKSIGTSIFASKTGGKGTSIAPTSFSSGKFGTSIRTPTSAASKGAAPAGVPGMGAPPNIPPGVDINKMLQGAGAGSALPPGVDINQMLQQAQGGAQKKQ